MTDCAAICSMHVTLSWTIYAPNSAGNFQLTFAAENAAEAERPRKGMLSPGEFFGGFQIKTPAKQPENTLFYCRPCLSSILCSSHYTSEQQPDLEIRVSSI